MIKADEYLNRDEFEARLHKVIDVGRQNFEARFKQRRSRRGSQISNRTIYEMRKANRPGQADAGLAARSITKVIPWCCGPSASRSKARSALGPASSLPHEACLHRFVTYNPSPRCPPRGHRDEGVYRGAAEPKLFRGVMRQNLASRWSRNALKSPLPRNASARSGDSRPSGRRRSAAAKPRSGSKSALLRGGKVGKLPLRVSRRS